MLAVCVTLCTLGLSLSAIAHEPSFSTFDPPGSTDTFSAYSFDAWLTRTSFPDSRSSTAMGLDTSSRPYWFS